MWLWLLSLVPAKESRQCLLAAHWEAQIHGDMSEMSSQHLPDVAEEEDETEDDTADCYWNEESHVLNTAVNII